MANVSCKWISEDMMTLNNTRWEVGVPNELPEDNNLKLGVKGLFHYYEHPFIASIFKRSHQCYYYTKLYEVLPEGRIVKGLDKCGATKLTLVKELEIPKISFTEKTAFAILCAKEIYKEEKFISWAEKWLSGEDRSKGSSVYAYNAQYNPVNLASAGEHEVGKFLAYSSAKFARNFSVLNCNDNLFSAVNCANDFDIDFTFVFCNTLMFLNVDNKNFDLILLAEKAMQIE